tara:strand:+ start:1058 stop:2134 length:1077 start_codon:yes stop_codon:yes gene_type:complete
MNILITGGCGFIGSCVIRSIIENTSHSVINVDKLTYAGNLDSVAKVSNSSRYAFEKSDICNKIKIRNIFQKYNPDAIMHLAAESHVDNSITSPGDFINTNILGTYTLLEVSREYFQSLTTAKKSKFRFHHISTDEVYGDLIHPDDVKKGKKLELFSEDSPYDPSSPYSATKASSDHLVRAWARTYNLPILITNCSNNYGPFQYPEKLIPKTIISAVSGKHIDVYGNGTQIRDWLHVEDHARALIKVIMNGRPGETYNIGSNNERRNIDVVRSICMILDEIIPPKEKTSSLNKESYSELIKYVDDRPGHDKRYAIDASKIYNDLGWTSSQTFEEGLEKTVIWYLDNKIWLKHLLSKKSK